MLSDTDEALCLICEAERHQRGTLRRLWRTSRLIQEHAKDSLLLMQAPTPTPDVGGGVRLLGGVSGEPTTGVVTVQRSDHHVCNPQAT